MHLSFLSSSPQRGTKGSQQSGFTLLEVIIAMAIMAIAFGSILAVEGGAVNASNRAKETAIVANLLRNKMVETEYSFEGKKFIEIKKEDQGTFKEPYQDYSWKREIKEVNLPDLTSIMAGNGGSSGKQDHPERDSDSSSFGPNQTAEMIGKKVSHFLSKSLREVTVTILWKRGGHQLSNSVSTYWVDLNNEFTLSEF